MTYYKLMVKYNDKYPPLDVGHAEQREGASLLLKIISHTIKVLSYEVVEETTDEKYTPTVDTKTWPWFCYYHQESPIFESFMSHTETRPWKRKDTKFYQNYQKGLCRYYRRYNKYYPITDMCNIK